MIGWQRDIFEGDYVRIITVDEYFDMPGYYNDDNARILMQEGGKVYQVEGCKYNGKIMLKGDERHAYPPEYLQPWHKDNVDGNISETDFTKLIGENDGRI